MKCPKCGSRLRYERYEDMYWCDPCYVVYYPEEIGMETDKSAPVFNIGGKNGGE